MYKKLIRENKTLVSICIFLFIFGIVQYTKPSCFYKRDGSIRSFGVGYKNKTIFPIWLFSLVLGILSYLAVNYYLALI